MKPESPRRRGIGLRGSNVEHGRLGAQVVQRDGFEFLFEAFGRLFPCAFDRIAGFSRGGHILAKHAGLDGLDDLKKADIAGWTSEEISPGFAPFAFD